MKKLFIVGLIIILILIIVFIVMFALFTGNDEQTPINTPTAEPVPIVTPTITPESLPPTTQTQTPEPTPELPYVWPPVLDPTRFDMPLEEWIEQNRVIPDPLPVFDLSSMVLFDDETVQAVLFSGFVPSFRYVWYGSRFPLEELVGKRLFEHG